MISKGKEPTKLKEYRATCATYDDGMDEEVRTAVVDQLMSEQRNRCAYCGVNLSKRDVKIEHWATRARHPELDLVYKSLFAVCYGDLFCGSQLHCDRSREENTDLTLNPIRPEHIAQLYFKKDGTLTSDNVYLFFDVNSPARLNLNCQELKGRRFRLLKDVRNRMYLLQKRGKTIQFKRLLDKEIADNESFNDIIIDYLRRKI